MGRWHREGYKRLRHLAVRVLLTSVLLYSCFCGLSIQCDAKEDNTGQNIEQDGGQKSAGYEGSAEVTAYVSMEPEQPSDCPDDSEISDVDGRKVKTGDNSELIHLLCIVIGSLIIIVYGIFQLYVDNLKKKTYKSRKK